MNGNKSPFLAALLFVCLLCSCTGGLSDTATSSNDGVAATSVAGAAATADDATDASAETQVGTNVGNPNAPVKAAVTGITFKTTTSSATDEVTTATDGEESESETESASTDSSCDLIRFDTNQHIAISQECSVTTGNYELAIMGVYLVACADDLGVPVLCNPKLASTVSSRVSLYEGDPVVVSMSGEDAEFPAELESFPEGTSIDAGGFQIVTSYVGQRFPEDSDEADKISDYLQGKAFRICTTPTDVGTDTMLSRCGNASAEYGDFLVDLDDDGTFGFINTTSLSSGSGAETASRPESYGNFVDFLITQLEGDISHETTTDYFSVAGYFSQLWAFTDFVSLTEDAGESFVATFDVSNTVRFIDGEAGRSESADDICVSALIEDGCRYGDDDPYSVGVYDPFYDAMPSVEPPLPSVESGE